MEKISFKSWLFFSLFSLIYANSAAVSQEEQLTSSPHECIHHSYNIRIFSISPLVIYISDFLSRDERVHVLAATKGTFASSIVADEVGTLGQKSTRKSKSTTIPRDTIVRCIEIRALGLQGFLPRSHLEPLQLVSYTQNESFYFHTDWFTNPSQAGPEVGYNRWSSIFAYVETEMITGGGTNFPLLDAPKTHEWCEFIDCDEPWENGVTFRPIAGNAIFWMNMIDDGTGRFVGDERVLHAGLPLTTGRKVGMNVWTREESLSDSFIDRDE